MSAKRIHEVCKRIAELDEQIQAARFSAWDSHYRENWPELPPAHGVKGPPDYSKEAEYWEGQVASLTEKQKDLRQQERELFAALKRRQ